MLYSTGFYTLIRRFTRRAPNFANAFKVKRLKIMDKLVTMNIQCEVQNSTRMEKILADRRAVLAEKESKRA